MARYTEAVCRMCRREGSKLFLKGTRCLGPNCSVNKRAYAPGEHGQGRVKLSDYGIQLREKQKLRRMYGVLEKQFRGYFKMAENAGGVTGEVLLQLLERRLDNVIFRSGFAASRSQARQMVLHGHVLVNGRKVNIASYLTLPEQKISITGKEEYKKRVKEIQESIQDISAPEWLAVKADILESTIIRYPERKDIKFPVREQLIVELYSK